MKNKIIVSIILFHFLFGMNLLLAQSDFEIVENFKKRVSQVEQHIKDADSLAELAKVDREIEKLRSDFIPNEELLNRSLYPNNFDKTFRNLREAYQLRENDFTQIDVLATEVTGLRVEVDTLRRRNNELTLQFEELGQQTSARIGELEKTIARLNSSLKKRDQIVMNMIDSMLIPSGSDGELSPKEKQQLLSEAEQNNVLYHIKRAVNDNIRFINATELQPDDIEELRNRQQNFFRIWGSVGPTMVELYAARGKSTNELKEIDEAFSRWHNELNREVWVSIRSKFAGNNVKLQNFSSGEEFTAVITNYIGDEIRNANTRGNDETEATYNRFVDSTWYSGINSEWLPFLLDNNMLDEKDKDTIEVMIASWKDTVYPGGINWLYIVIAVVVIALIIFFFTRKPQKTTETIISSEPS
jgi:hypothetical protein